MKRKLQTALIVAVAVAAGIGGYLANRNSLTTTTQTREVPLETVNALLALSLADTEGQLQALEQWRGKVIVANFWATWCPPCVKEMPELDRFQREFAAKGWKVVGLAVDGPTPVREFLAKVQVGFDIGLAGFGGTELSQTLGNTVGGLPFTVLIDAQGRVRQRIMGITDLARLSEQARRIQPG